MRRTLLPRLMLGPTTVAVLLGVVATLAASCAPAPRTRPIKMGGVDTGPNSLEAVRRQLEGTWDLVSLDTHASPSGPATRAEGASAVLTYDAYGNLQIMGKPGTSGSMPAAAELLTYSGRAVIDPAKQELRLQDMKGQTDPNATLSKDVAAERVRRYKIENGVLTISVLNASGQVSATTVWKKRP